MTFLESLVVDGFGLSIVFVVLISLSLIIKLISIIVGRFNKKASLSVSPSGEVSGEAVMADTQAPEYTDGELKLIDVDEKTAALIMAIVSDDTEIPLSQLRFKSIRLLKQEGK